MNIVDMLAEHRFIVCGYGQAFTIVNKFVKINCDIVVDNDPRKWGAKEGHYVVGFKHLKRINLQPYKVLVLPYNNQDILTELLTLGVKENSIYTLKELLIDQTFMKLYNDHKNLVPPPTINPIEEELNKFIRSIRSQSIPKQFSIDCRQLFSKWFDSEPLIYRQIDLKQVLAADVSILLEHFHILDREIKLEYPPVAETYSLYGDGEIFVPMFARTRNDHVNRMKAIISGIIPNTTIMTYMDFDINLDLKQTAIYDFVFNFNRIEEHWIRRIIEQLESIYYTLTIDEKDWLSHLINYYIQLIDFFIDTVRLECKVMLSLFPYYKQENIIFQLGKLNHSIDVVYQHGNYADETSKDRFHTYLYTFAMQSDFYLVWNDKARQDLITLHGKKKEQIFVLGNPMQIIRKKNDSAGTSKKFLIICPGKVLNHFRKIEELINAAEVVSKKFQMNYDIRFHPLNMINWDLKKLEYFSRNVNVNNCIYEEYDFFIGTESALLDEIRDGGFLVFSKVNNRIMHYEYTNNEELLFLVEKQRYTVDIRTTGPNQDNVDEIRNRHAVFLMNLLKEQKQI